MFALALSTCLFAQNDLPILRTNTSDLSVKDGDEFRENYWREYFTEKILMPKLREKGLINKEEDHVDMLKK